MCSCPIGQYYNQQQGGHTTVVINNTTHHQQNHSSGGEGFATGKSLVMTPQTPESQRYTVPAISMISVVYRRVALGGSLMTPLVVERITAYSGGSPLYTYSL